MESSGSRPQRRGYSPNAYLRGLESAKSSAPSISDVDLYQKLLYILRNGPSSGDELMARFISVPKEQLDRVTERLVAQRLVERTLDGGIEVFRLTEDGQKFTAA